MQAALRPPDAVAFAYRSAELRGGRADLCRLVRGAACAAGGTSAVVIVLVIRPSGVAVVIRALSG